MKRLASKYPEDAYEMVLNNKLDLSQFLALVLYDDNYFDRICEKLSSYHNFGRMVPLINNFTIPRAEYDGKNGLVKLEYKAFYKFYEGDTDEEEVKDYYTNVNFTIDTNSNELVFWFPLFS
ncbi:MAG: hypothetical protein J0H74_06955 [Chitinophagaceae bacterium]|nr:hypothetical protein [Chitinophagaceae bacterium]